MPSELADASQLPKLIQALTEAGYDDDSLEEIAYRNWFRVLRDSWKSS